MDLKTLSKEYSDKLENIQKWLEKVFHPEKAPEFEICEETIDILEKYKLQFEEIEHQKKVQEEVLKGEVEEMKCERRRLELIFKNLNIHFKNYPEIETLLNTLSRVAVELDVVSPSSVSCSSAIVNLISKIENNQFELETVKEKLNDLKILKNQMEEMQDYIDGFYQRLEKNLESEKKCAKRNHIEMKREVMEAKKFEQQISKYQDTLHENGYKSSLTHQKLHQLGTEVISQRENLAALQLKLKSYKDLPKNEDLARIKLLEKKSECKEIEDKIQSKLCGISLCNQSNLSGT